ncbi:MAG TPA: hypothetical protein VFV38_06985 [Ktedonobacteraceae bacterium]|nr:hypothetical protein [Ktedonobacteraceae bacterium]
MVQALPRYCLRCSTPIQAGMQRCSTCDFSIEAMLSHSDKKHETSGYDDAAPQGTPVPTLRYTPREDDNLLPIHQSNWYTPGKSGQFPRFLPGSPLPLEPGMWHSSHCQAIQPYEPVQQELHPAQALTGEPPNSPAPADPPENPVPDGPSSTQSETDKDDGAAPQEAPAAPSRRVENAEALPASPGTQAHPPARIARSTPGTSIQPPRFSPHSPPPPTASERNTPGGRRRAGAVFIVLATLLTIASSSYFIFSSYAPRTNRSPGAIGDAHATASANDAHANLYNTSGTLVFFDPLQAANADWDQNASCAFKGGGYHVTSTTIQACTLNKKVALTNFLLEVKVTLLHGDVGGFLLREDNPSHKGNAYLLDFDSQGHYQLWNYGVSGAAEIMGYGLTSALSAGYNQPNVIALAVQGPDMTLYINGQTVKSFTDTTRTIGEVSLVSSEYAHQVGTSEAAYNDLRLWKL